MSGWTISLTLEEEKKMAREWMDGYQAAIHRDLLAFKSGKRYGPWEKSNYCRNPNNLHWAERILGIKNVKPQYVPQFTTLPDPAGE